MSRSRFISMIPLAAMVAFLIFRHSGNGDGEVFPPPDPVLSRVVSHCDFKDTDLRDALEILSERTGVPIQVDWKKLEAEGHSAGKGVTFQHDEVPLEDALLAVLWDAPRFRNAPYWDHQRLVYSADGSGITITTFESADSGAVCRMYPIGDIVEEMEMSDWPMDGIGGPRFRFRWQRPGECFSRVVAAGLAMEQPDRFFTIPASEVREEALRGLLIRVMEEGLPWRHDPNFQPIFVVKDRFFVIAPPKQQAAVSGCLKELRGHRFPEAYRGQVDDPSE